MRRPISRLLTTYAAWLAASAVLGANVGSLLLPFSNLTNMPSWHLPVHDEWHCLIPAGDVTVSDVMNIELRHKTIGAPELPLLEDLRMGLPAPDVGKAVAAAALLSDPTRASIVRMLRGGPVCVCELAAALSERQNNVSNHLTRLRDAGLVRASRAGSDTRRTYYERDDGACRRALAVLREVLE